MQMVLRTGILNNSVSGVYRPVFAFQPMQRPLLDFSACVPLVGFEPTATRLGGERSSTEL